MSKITTVFLDVDGTLTDGKIYYDSQNNEMKAFNIKDGLIIYFMARNGYNFVIVTGRESNIVTRRMEELGVSEIYQGISIKDDFIKEYLGTRHLEYEACAYLGDDLNDLMAMKKLKAHKKICINKQGTITCTL